MRAPPVIVYPLHGCQEVTHVNERESLLRAGKLREMVRKHWNEPGVKAFIELLEQRTARTQRQAIQPGATQHEAGQAYGLNEFLALLHGIVVSVEK
jgi:hypothetical protein